MSNDPQADLIYALLALDAYNRGYGAGIKDLATSGISAKVGDWSIITTATDELDESEAAGFYAIAYRNAATGEVVISYRGTDNLNALTDESSDINTGWPIGGGSFIAPQAELAVQFYKAVVGADADGYFTADPFAANITLTGHSLGGGLAGYIASLYGQGGTIFDNMPFELASTLANGTAALSDWSGIGSYRQTLYGQYDVPAIDRSGIGGWFTENEILQTLRHLQSTEVTPLESYSDISSIDVAGRALKLHMMDLLVNLLWAKANDRTVWTSAGSELWRAYFDDDVAKAISGIDSAKGEASYAGTMGRMIAYSALDRLDNADATAAEKAADDASKPFGDTAIWSMFHDAGDLGAVLAGNESGFFDDKVTERDGLIFNTTIDVKQHLANLLVQYAGALALYDVEQAADAKTTVEGGSVDVREGILSRTEADSALAVDMSRQLWSEALGGKAVAPIDRDAFRQAYFKQAEDPSFWASFKRLFGLGGESGFSDADLQKLAKDIWGSTNLDIFDRFHIAPTDTATTVMLDARGYLSNNGLGDKAQVDVYIGTAANEAIVNHTTGHNLIITGGGDDSVNAGGGNDVVFSSGGADRLDGGEGNDRITALDGHGAVTAGGLGRDIVINLTQGGKVYGDTKSGYYEKPLFNADGSPRLNADGTHKTELTKVEDNSANSDLFWFAPDVEIMDAQKSDRLVYNGFGLTGGDRNPAYVFAFGGALAARALGSLNALGYGNALGGAVAFAAQAAGLYFDKLKPNIVYHYTPTGKNDLGEEVGDLKIVDMFGAFNALFGTANVAGDPIKPMVVHNFHLESGFFGVQQAELAQNGTLGMAFKEANPLDLALAVTGPLLRASGLTAAFVIELQALLLLDYAFGLGTAIGQAAKIAKWIDGSDPLIIDLDGDGIETTALASGQVYFDVDGDMFAERTGWLGGDDGFVVLDLNGNGRIDDISEMFGGVGASGFAELASLDSNADGKITVADVAWADLKVWQDRDQDGLTDDGELSSLAALGIVSLDLARTDIDITTPQGALLVGYGDATFANGITRRMFDAIFASNDTDTKYAGETGRAPWQAGLRLDAKGFGTLTDLSVAMANDVALGELAAETAAEMTTPDLRTLVAQAGDVLGNWGQTLELTRELAPVLVGTDAAGKAVLLDRGVYVEDSQGGYWTLASGASVLDAQGAPIARASLADVLAQSAQASGGTWRLEQMWSPSDRAAAVQFREEAPYLIQVVNGRAVILDYGVKQADGTWKLASDVAAGLGTSYASKAAITASAKPAGAEWRVEEIGFNPYADLPVDRIGVRFTDGQVVDYTVQVTDSQGTFHVWARNLDRALQLEFRYGDARPFELRNYAIDFETLDEVNSSDDSTYRVEMLTPAQFHFATSLGGIDFRPEMLSATLNDATGHLAYAVGPTGSANLSTDPTRYVSGITAMIDLLQPVMEQYIVTSRRFVVFPKASSSMQQIVQHRRAIRPGQSSAAACLSPRWAISNRLRSMSEAGSSVSSKRRRLRVAPVGLKIGCSQIPTTAGANDVEPLFRIQEAA